MVFLHLQRWTVFMPLIFIFEVIFGVITAVRGRSMFFWLNFVESDVSGSNNKRSKGTRLSSIYIAVYLQVNIFVYRYGAVC
jgi:hypothetical protein